MGVLLLTLVIVGIFFLAVGLCAVFFSPSLIDEEEAKRVERKHGRVSTDPIFREQMRATSYNPPLY
jgi:hypothetical protein